MSVLRQPLDLMETTASIPRPSIVNCTWRYHTQPLDHFNEGATSLGNATFRQRYCIYTKYWEQDANAETGGVRPILFYTGNESPVEEYINNTGLMWELAPKLSALIVFAEHRYAFDIVSTSQKRGIKNDFIDLGFSYVRLEFSKFDTEETAMHISCVVSLCNQV